MFYVEYLRVRRAVLTYAIVVAAICLILTVSLRLGHVVIGGDELKTNYVRVPLTMLIVVAAFGSLIFATLTSVSLNRERATLALAWTRPISRERMAVSYMLVDGAGIAATFLLTLALESVPLVTTGLISRVYLDPLALGSVLLMVGVTLMFYGILQALTSWYHGRAGLVVGLSWGLFSTLLSFGHAQMFGPLVTSISNALNFVNPLAYMSSYHFSNGGQIDSTSYLMLAESVRTAISATIGVIGCAIAVFAWKHAEA